MRQPFDDYEGRRYDDSVVSIVSMVKTRLGLYKFLGSGFLIGPGLAVTAKHVIDGFIAEYHEEIDHDTWGKFFFPEESRFDLFAYNRQDEPKVTQVFKVDLVSFSAFSDFAVLR